MLHGVFTPAVRRVTAALWLVGAGICVATALRAATHSGGASAFVLAAVAFGLVALAIATAHAAGWALLVSGVLLGAQLFGALGSAWELVTGVEGSKARELRELGVGPTFGVALNLVYSLVAFTVFVWAILGRRQ